MITGWKHFRSPAPSATVDPEGAILALGHSRQMLAEEQCRTGSVKEVTDSMKELRQKNHFADLLEEAFSNKAARQHG